MEIEAQKKNEELKQKIADIEEKINFLRKQK
jgi:hypothetical protein